MQELQRLINLVLIVALLMTAFVSSAWAQDVSGDTFTGAPAAHAADTVAPVAARDDWTDGFDVDLDIATDYLDTDTLAAPAPVELLGQLADGELMSQPAEATVLDGAVAERFARTDGVLPATVFDADEIGWASVRNMSSAAFSAHFDAMKDDYMLIDIEVDEINGQQRVGAVWQRNSDDRGWAEWRNLTSEQFSDKWNDYREQGYRLIDQEAYTLGGVRYYAGVWVENVEGYGWASYRNLTSADFSEKFAEFKDDYIIIDVEAYPTGSGLRYAMVWVRNVDDLDWAEWRNLSSDEFGEKFDQYRNDYRMWDIESYRDGGQQYYAGIWIENTNNRGWAEYRDMSATAYRNRWYRLRDQGYRLVDYEIYPTASGYRYAGVWRQNSDRPNWALKNAVDARVQSELDTFGVPGIGVAIAQNGEIKYMRGFGHQDVDAGLWYSARTVNRLASVAKAVTGVLALTLRNDGAIGDLDDATRSYVPTMPNAHTHTLRQLLANRGGIGHYADHGTPNGNYASGLQAAQAFWNDPLPYAPGANCIYSTHGYTLAAAAFEAAAGQPMEDILTSQISEPYGLTTLRVEDLTIADDNRSLVYDDAGNEAAYDDIYWKAYGGGEEASSYDLVRFGMKVLDDTILDAADRTELWSVPAPTPCIGLDGRNQSGYALGWDTGTDQGTPVVAKGGNQLGANTYIRMYPERDIVIVVLMNRNGGGHSSAQLGRDIGTLLLDAEDASATAYDLDGLPHYVLGAVQAVWTQFGQLLLTNFGASGEDGVAVTLANVDVWQSELTLSMRAMRSGATTAKFELYAADQRLPAGSLTLERTSDGLKLLPLFTTPAYEVQYVLDNRIVLRKPGGDTSAIMPWDELWCIMELPPGHPSEICRILTSYYGGANGHGEWNVLLPAALTLADGAGGTVMANRIRLVAQGDAAAQAAGVQELASLRIRGANLDALTLMSAQAGGLELAPTTPVDPNVPGESTSNAIFLPLVTR